MPKPRPKDAPRPFTAGGGTATVRAEKAGPGGKPKLATFSGVAYTGAPMHPEGWGGGIVVDLAGVRFPADHHRPVLRQHDHEQLVGHTDRIEVTAKGLEVAGVLSGEPAHAAKVSHPAGNGFKWQLSIGATPVRTEDLDAGEEAEVNGRTVTGPLTISRETDLGEVSFVPLGADGDTSATVTATRRTTAVKKIKAMLKAAASKFSDEEIDKMTDDEARAALKKCMADDAPPEKKDDAEAEDGDDDRVDAEGEEEAEAEEGEDDPPPAKAKAGKRKAAIAAAARDGVKAARDAVSKELKRVADIKAKLAGYGPAVNAEVGGKTVDLERHAVAKGWTAEKAELYALRASRPGAGTGGPLVYVTSRPEVTDAVIEAAVFQAGRCELFEDDFYQSARGERGPLPERDRKRIKAELDARYPDKVQQAAHTLFKSRVGLQQVLTTIAAQGGYRGSEVIRDDGDIARVAAACMTPIRADGTSTSSIANVLQNVLNKFLQTGYLFTEQSWKEVSAVRPVKDFKPTKAVNLFGDFEFQPVGAAGELKNAVLGDQAFANQASTVGRLLTIPRTHIINDDLGALTGVPQLLGRGAGLRLNRVFWGTYLSPGNDNGGSTAFYAATHTIAGEQAASNYLAGGTSALSSAGLQKAKQLFDKQVDPQGYPLGVDPRLLVYPVELDQTVWELLNSSMIVAGGQSASDRQPSNNRWQNKYKPVMSRYLSNANFAGASATAWYLQADPAELPVIETCFLNGQEAPTVQTAGPDFQFSTLGITVRGFFDFGVAAQNFRGGVKMAGA